MQMSSTLPSAFLSAGLPLPTMALEGIVGTDANWIGYDFMTDVLSDILPKLHEYGVLHDPLDAERYVEQLRDEVTKHQTIVPLCFMAGAWAQKAQ
jgi:hypothetical protein